MSAAADPPGAASEATPPFLLGVDLGSSSARAFLFDSRGGAMAGERIRYAWTASHDGGLEIPAEDLVGITARAIDGALVFARARGIGISAVGVSAFWHGLVGLSSTGAPMTPVYSWGDTRATSAAADLRASIHEEEWHRRTGAFLHPSFPAVKLHWIRGTDPDRFREVRTWLSPGDYLAMRFCGTRRAGISMASASGLFDQNRCEWDDETLRAIGLDRHTLPELAAEGETFALEGEFAERWPELRGVPWLPPIGDGAAANLGSGCISAACAALSVGTTAALRVIHEAETVEIPSRLFTYRLDRRRFVIGGATSNGGNVYQWAREVLRLPDDGERVESILATIPPDGHGLTVLPFLAGERSPGWPLDATGLIAGATVATTAADIMLAALEAVAYRLALVRESLLTAVPESRTIVASGRAIGESLLFTRILCDVLGEPLRVSTFEETSSRGAALLAGEAIGALDLAGIPPPDTEIREPDRSRFATYRRAMERQRRIEEAVEGD